MPVQLDLTGVCYVCYLPLIAPPLQSGLCGKICPWDRSHTPRVKLPDVGVAQELLASLSPELVILQDVRVAGVSLPAGSELYCEPQQVFRIVGSERKALDLPDRREAFQRSLFVGLEGGASVQVTFRSPRLSSQLLLASGQPSPHDGSLVRIGSRADEGVRLLAPRDSPQQRQDPSDGTVYTWQELQRRYMTEFGAREICDYWCSKCVAQGALEQDGLAASGLTPSDDPPPPPPRSRGRGRGRGRLGAGTETSLPAAGTPQSLDEPPIGRARGRGRAVGLAGFGCNAHSVSEEATSVLAVPSDDAPDIPPDAPAVRRRGRGRGSNGFSITPSDERPKASDGRIGAGQLEGQVPTCNGVSDSEKDVAVSGPAGVSRARGRGRGRGLLAAPSPQPASPRPFDAASWLSEVEPTGLLAPYEESIVAHFESLEAIREMYKAKGAAELFATLGVKKLGHKRIMEKALLVE